MSSAPRRQRPGQHRRGRRPVTAGPGRDRIRTGRGRPHQARPRARPGEERLRERPDRGGRRRPRPCRLRSGPRPRPYATGPTGCAPASASGAADGRRRRAGATIRPPRPRRGGNGVGAVAALVSAPAALRQKPPNAIESDQRKDQADPERPHEHQHDSDDHQDPAEADSTHVVLRVRQFVAGSPALIAVPRARRRYACAGVSAPRTTAPKRSTAVSSSVSVRWLNDSRSVFAAGVADVEGRARDVGHAGLQSGRAHRERVEPRPAV